MTTLTASFVKAITPFHRRVCHRWMASKYPCKHGSHEQLKKSLKPPFEFALWTKRQQSQDWMKVEIKQINSTKGKCTTQKLLFTRSHFRNLSTVPVVEPYKQNHSLKGDWDNLELWQKFIHRLKRKNHITDSRLGCGTEGINAAVLNLSTYVKIWSLLPEILSFYSQFWNRRSLAIVRHWVSVQKLPNHSINQSINDLMISNLPFFWRTSILVTRIDTCTLPGEFVYSNPQSFAQNCMKWKDLLNFNTFVLKWSESYLEKKFTKCFWCNSFPTHTKYSKSSKASLPSLFTGLSHELYTHLRTPPCCRLRTKRIG